MNINARCERDICVCNAAGDSEYCSDQCRVAAADDVIEISCDCGHAECGNF